MIQKDKFLNCLQKSLREDPVDISFLIELISQYLQDIKYKKADLLMSFIIQNPDLVKIALPTVFEHFRRKFAINSVMFNNKIILYYDSY